MIVPIIAQLSSELVCHNKKAAKCLSIRPSIRPENEIISAHLTGLRVIPAGNIFVCIKAVHERMTALFYRSIKFFNGPSWNKS